MLCTWRRRPAMRFRLDPGQPEQLALTGQPLEGMEPGVLERESRPFEETVRRVRDHDLARTGDRQDPRGGMNGHASDILGDELDLARVDADAYLHAESFSRPNHRGAATDGVRRSVEDHEKAIAGGRDLTATKGIDHLP